MSETSLSINLNAPAFVKRLTLAAFIGLLLAYFFIVIFADGQKAFAGGRLGGDFPAFYSAGKMILDGQHELLYDLPTQRAVQNKIPGFESETSHLIFAYPPFVAMIFAPFALLDFKLAYIMWTMLMAGCLFLAVRKLTELSGLQKSYQKWIFILALLSYPLFRAVTGGQNTSLSLLCLVYAYSNLIKGRDITSGVFLGLWFFKAQFALPALVLFLFKKRWRVLIGMVPVALFYYFVAASSQGIYWPYNWLTEVALPFAELDKQGNLTNFITIRSFIERSIISLSSFSSLMISVLLIGMCFFTLNKVHSLAALGIIALTVIVAAQHAVFYDAGLALPAVVYLASKFDYKYVFVIISASWLDIFSQNLPFQPTLLLLISIIIMLFTKAHSSYS